MASDDGYSASTTPLKSADDSELLSRLEGVEMRPVFIVGSHRSGTTVLYQILAATGAFNVTTAYHVINRRRLLVLSSTGAEQDERAELMRLFESRGLKDRTFDSMPITPDMPEEYAYALAHQGRRPKLCDSNLESFIQFCKKVQAVQQPESPLLLKNPYDTDNFLYIHREFPHARFIFLHRNPVDVVNSQMKAVVSLLERRNEYVALVSERYRRAFERPWLVALARRLYSAESPLLFHQTARSVARTCDYIVKHIDRLGETACSVTYPRLCEEPNQTIQRVLRFLDLDERRDQDYASFIRPRPRNLLRAVEARQALVERRTRTYGERFGV